MFEIFDKLYTIDDIEILIIHFQSFDYFDTKQSSRMA